MPMRSFRPPKRKGGFHPLPDMQTTHEPLECGVRGAKCGAAGSRLPLFSSSSSSSSSSSLVLGGSGPVAHVPKHLTTTHEPSECGVRDAGCGTGASSPRFSSSSLVLVPRPPRFMAGEQVRTEQGAFHEPIPPGRPSAAGRTSPPARLCRLKPALSPVRNVQRPTFNIQHPTAAAVGRSTLNVGRLMFGRRPSPRAVVPTAVRTPSPPVGERDGVRGRSVRSLHVSPHPRIGHEASRTRDEGRGRGRGRGQARQATFPHSARRTTHSALRR